MRVVCGMIMRVRAEVRDLKFESHFPHIFFIYYTTLVPILSRFARPGCNNRGVKMVVNRE